MITIADITNLQPASGSGFNQLYTGRFGFRDVFIKVAGSADQTAALKGESIGLRKLAGTGTIRIPEVIQLQTDNLPAYLMMERIGKGNPGPAFWELFGRQLADLHRVSSPTFGFEEITYCGTIPMDNSIRSGWNSFYFENRLEPTFRWCYDHGLFTDTDFDIFRRFSSWFLAENPFPPEPPSLIHGDLWSGNFLVDEQGRPVLIDPSVSFGHREIDLGMSELFGGFDRRFYRAYEESFPLAEGWPQRRPLAQLFHLLLHVRLFGGGYRSQTLSAMKQYG